MMINAQRSAEQSARRFLSTAFKNDTVDATQPTPAAALAASESFTFVVKLGPVDGPLREEASSLHLTVFDHARQQFLGKTHVVEIRDGAVAAEQFMFHAPINGTYFVVEAVRQSLGREKVVAWSYVGVPDLAAKTQLDFYRGSALLLQLHPDKWRAMAQPAAGSVATEISVVRQRTPLMALLPPGVCAPHDYADISTAAPPRKPFRVRLENFRLTPCSSNPGAGKAMLSVGQQSWSIAALGHNKWVQFASTTDCALKESAAGGGGAWESIQFNSVELGSLPVHPDTALVLCLRRRVGGEPQQRVVGYAVLPLVTPDLKDRDVHIGGIPVITGPFSSSDPRFTSLDKSQRYARCPLTISFDIAFFDTPNKAPMIERARSGDAGAAAKAAATPSAVATATPSAVGASRSAVPAGATIPEKKVPELQATQPQVGAQPAAASTAGGGSVPAPAAAPGVGPSIGAAPAAEISEIHKMLCALMEEVNVIRREVSTGRAASGPAAPAPEAAAAAVAAAAQQQQQQQQRAGADGVLGPLEIVDLNPRRVGIRHGTRLKMTQDLQPLMHPVRKTRLIGGEASSTLLPISQLGIRFEGVTVSHGWVVPGRLVVRTSFSFLQEQRIGPMTLIKCDTDDALGTTFAVGGDGGGRGQVWVEPPLEQQIDDVTPEAIQLWKRDRTGDGSIHLHLYDALSDFYFSTAAIPIALFHRPPGVAATVHAHDVQLFWDASLGSGGVVSQPFFPLLSTSGQLHVTLVSIGHAVPVSAAGFSEVSAVPKSSGNGGATIVAKRLPVDFGEGTAVTAPSPAAAPVASAGSNNGGIGLTNPQRNLHVQRANFVKSLLADDAARKKLFGERAALGTASADLEFKLRYAERRRDEVKATKIAEVLRERVTERFKVCTSRSRPETVKVPFVNPFPQTISFMIDVAPTSLRWLHIHGSCPLVLTLGPKESVTIPAVVRIDDVLASRSATVSFQVRTEKGEVVRVVEIAVQIVPPVVHRRYTMFGPRGCEVKQSFYSRPFAATLFTEAELATKPLESLFDRLGRLCCFPRVSDESVRVVADAKVDPITMGKAVSWETIEVSARVAESGADREFFVFLYKDEQCTALWETWQIRVRAARVFDTDTITYGCANTITVLLDEPIDAAFVNHSTVEILSPASGAAAAPSRELTLRIKPREMGMHPILVHARKGDRLDRVVCNVQCVPPTRKNVSEFYFSEAEVAQPVFKAFTFINEDSRQRMFKIFHNYETVLSCSPMVFALGPQERQKVQVQMRNLMPGRFPMWIFVNDNNDANVESFFLNVVVGAQQPIM